MTTGFPGGGLQGPGFGTAIDANDHVWINSTSGKTISLFDKTGKPLSPPEGYNFGGKLGFMQGVIVTPSGDVWAVDFSNDASCSCPRATRRKAKFYCEAPAGTPNKDGPCKLNAPFHLVIDQQDRIWIDSAIGEQRHALPGERPEQGRGVFQRRPQRQGHGGRQQGQCLDHQHAGRRACRSKRTRACWWRS